MIDKNKLFWHRHWMDFLAVVLIAALVEINTIVLNFRKRQIK